MSGTTLETVLVLDRGLVGARVVVAVQERGARAVTLRLDGEDPLPADDSVLLGGPGSDLDVVKLVEAARQCGADAVHPGAAALAASPELAAAVVEAGLVWVGPPAAHLGGTPVLPADRVELQCLDGVVLDARTVHGDLLVCLGRPGDGVAVDVPGVATAVGDLAVPHLTLGTLVSEVALGLDLVGLQLRTASGHDVEYAVTARATAAAVVRGTGLISLLALPEGALTACREGAVVPPDGVVAVVVATGDSPEAARAALREALWQTRVEALDVTVPDLEERPA